MHSLSPRGVGSKNRNTSWALIAPVSNCAEYEKVFISAFNGNIRHKISQKKRVHAKDAIYQISKKDKVSKRWYSFLK